MSKIVRAIVYLWLFLHGASVWAQDPASPAYSGYLRAGTGMSGKGGDQECFTNQGASANEFRLGNECEIYGELGAKLNAYKREQLNFDAFFRVAVVSPGHSSFEGTNEQFHLVEAFVEAGGFLKNGIKVWGGKRFYREHQLQMYDWYYFGNTSGNGAGVTGVPVGRGKIDVAALLEAGSTISDHGRHNVAMLDFRWRDIAIGDSAKLSVWLGYARATGGISLGTQYEESDGWLAAGLLQFPRSKGFDEISVLHGRRLLQSLSLYGDPAPVAGVSAQSSQYRWRFVYYGGENSTVAWAWQRALVYENWNTGRWMSAGVGPVFFITDQIHVASVLGSSAVEEWGGAMRNLTRLTIAPQLAPERSQWSRPALRIFYTHSWWNSENQSAIAQPAPAYRYARSGGAVGVQVEHWF